MHLYIQIHTDIQIEAKIVWSGNVGRENERRQDKWFQQGRKECVVSLSDGRGKANAGEHFVGGDERRVDVMTYDQGTDKSEGTVRLFQNGKISRIISGKNEFIKQYEF